MRRILLTTLLAVSFVSSGKAQQEMTGDKAEQIKQEILKLEHDKVATMLQSGSAFSEWRDRHDADEMVNTDANGVTTTKAENVARLRARDSGGGDMLKLVSMKQYGHVVRVYADGNVAVCTMRADPVYNKKGETISHQWVDLDIWAKFPDGAWRRIAHSVHNAPKQ